MRYIDSKFLVLIKNNFAFTQPIEDIIANVKVSNSAILDLQVAIPIYLIGSASSKTLANALMHIAKVLDSFNSTSTYFKMTYSSDFNIDTSTPLSSKENIVKIIHNALADVDAAAILKASTNFKVKSTATIHAHWDRYLESQVIVRELYKATINKCSSSAISSTDKFTTNSGALLDSATITQLLDAIGGTKYSSDINIAFCLPVLLGQCNDLVKGKAYASKLDTAGVINPTSTDGFRVGSLAAIGLIFMAGLSDIDSLTLSDIDSLTFTELDFIGGN